MKKILAFFALSASLFAVAGNKPFIIGDGPTVTMSVDGDAPVLRSAVDMFAADVRAVLGDSLVFISDKAQIRVLAGDTARTRAAESFVLEVMPDGTLTIAGADAHGAAYGLLELSRLMGVSPWEWWADATPARRDTFTLPAGFELKEAPAVDYRGIFINDEDWGLMPWSSTTMEPGNKRGVIGPATNEKIFQLMLRLRANYYWPAMHEVTEPFFLTPGNREMAQKYGIYIGGSHCEPMASSTAVEWGRRGHGDYDYVANRDSVLAFWEERVRDVADQEIVYTLGMRGVHDGAMNGAKTVEQQRDVLTRAIADQRALIQKYVDSTLTSVPQVFIPYKEVLDVYRAGLEVPDDVALMWCDDNYGYIRHFPTEAERARSGGNGIYYHVSYWGRPHDYLWLGTLSPYLLYQQMGEAYRSGIQRMWILNVGDIKPAEYQIELFLDMAWDMDGVTNVDAHLGSFLEREFGAEAAVRLLPVMKRHYHLAYIRKPEHTGGTRTEEADRKRWNTIVDLPFTDDEVTQRIADYRAISDAVEEIESLIPAEWRDEYFQLVKYPVQGAAQMNFKHLYGQLARHGKADWSHSAAAYDSIVALTETYNEGIANGGKWRGIMSMRPRKLSAFDPLKPGVNTAAECEAPALPKRRFIDASQHGGDAAILHPGLGYGEKTIEIPLGATVNYDLGKLKGDSVTIDLHFVPTHPAIDGAGLKVAVSLDGGEPIEADYSTQGRSEEWKENVLQSQAVRSFAFPLRGRKLHKLAITARTPGILLDRIAIQQ